MQALAWAEKQRTGSGTRKAVLLCLANFCTDEGLSWPAMQTIQDSTELSRRSIRRVLEELIEGGWIVAENRLYPGGQQTNDIYRLRFGDAAQSDTAPKVGSVPKSGTAPTSDKNVTPNAPPEAEKIPPPSYKDQIKSLSVKKRGESVSRDPLPNVGSVPTSDKNVTLPTEHIPPKARPATIADVQQYMAERGVTDAEEAQKWWDHYSANGWRIGGKTAMKDWQASVRNWLRSATRFTPQSAKTLPEFMQESEAQSARVRAALPPPEQKIAIPGYEEDV